jgi:hypothetical protein
MKLEVCPCCGQGIKPARGFTWINGNKLFEGVVCKLKKHEDSVFIDQYPCTCVLDNPPEKMGLVWIGSGHYDTPEDFLMEAREQGVSRRIPAVPKEFEVGKTWVLFAHRKAFTQYCSHPKVREQLNEEDPPLNEQYEMDRMLTDEQVASCPDCKGEGVIYTAGIIGCFKPDRIEYIVAEKDTKKKLKRLQDRGLKLVNLEWDEEEDEDQPELFECDRCGKEAELYHYAPTDEALCDLCVTMAEQEDMDPDELSNGHEIERRLDQIMEEKYEQN